MRESNARLSLSVSIPNCSRRASESAAAVRVLGEGEIRDLGRSQEERERLPGRRALVVAELRRNRLGDERLQPRDRPRGSLSRLRRCAHAQHGGVFQQGKVDRRPASRAALAGLGRSGPEPGHQHEERRIKVTSGLGCGVGEAGHGLGLRLHGFDGQSRVRPRLSASRARPVWEHHLLARAWRSGP